MSGVEEEDSGKGMAPAQQEPLQKHFMTALMLRAISPQLFHDRA